MRPATVLETGFTQQNVQLYFQQITCKQCYDHFQTLFTTDNTSQLQQTQQSTDTQSPTGTLNQSITQQEVMSHIKQLANNKSILVIFQLHGEKVFYVHNVLGDFQEGFRPGYSTIDHIFTLNAIATKHSGTKDCTVYMLTFLKHLTLRNIIFS